jgi:hypothetical protein
VPRSGRTGLLNSDRRIWKREFGKRTAPFLGLFWLKRVIRGWYVEGDRNCQSEAGVGCFAEIRLCEKFQIAAVSLCFGELSTGAKSDDNSATLRKNRLEGE